MVLMRFVSGEVLAGIEIPESEGRRSVYLMLFFMMMGCGVSHLNALLMG